MARHEMETISEATERLEQCGFDHSFRAVSGGKLEAPGVEPLAPETLVIEETVRFEGTSDPQDEAVLFALRSKDGRIRGTFVTSYGPQVDPHSAAVIHRLEPEPRSESRS